jgi:magnesium transporter
LPKLDVAERTGKTEDMLINCVAYRNGRKLKDLAIEEISQYVNRMDTFIWIALKDPTKEDLETMGKEFDIHELAIEDAFNGNQRPKIEEYGYSLFVVLHTVEIDITGEFLTGEIEIFVGENYVLSVRNKTQQGFSSVRERCHREPELLKHGSAYVLYALIDTVVDRYFPVMSKLEYDLERIEERIFSDPESSRKNIQALYNLKRKLVVLQHAVVPLLEAVSKLHGGRVPQMCHGMQDYFRDVSDHVIRINKSIESLREMTTTAIQVNLTIISLNESEVTKKLASYGALFAFPTAIAGIYGMNFKFMPELDLKYGYPLVLITIVLADFILWFRFRKAGWL